MKITIDVDEKTLEKLADLERGVIGMNGGIRKQEIIDLALKAYKAECKKLAHLQQSPIKHPPSGQFGQAWGPHE